MSADAGGTRRGARAFRRLGRLALRALPHLCVAMTLALLALVAIDAVNDAMGFLVGATFRTFLVLYAAVAGATAVAFIASRSRKG